MFANDQIAAGTNDSAFDMTGDGNVDMDDLDAWLAEAGEANLGPGQSYQYGDANLDGIVDGADFVLQIKDVIQRSVEVF